MKQVTIIYVLAVLAIAGAACKKNKSTPTPTPTPAPTTAPTLSVSNMDGTLVSMRVDVTAVTAGYPVTITTESALASFFTTTGGSTMADAGTVTVNGITLDKQSNNNYFKTASPGTTPSDLSFSGGSNWNVTGAGGVSAFTYNHTIAFPAYTGTIPDSITRSAGITISLSGKVSNADSVIVLVAAGNKSAIKSAPGTASSVTFSAADLSGLPAVTDKSAFFEVVPYRITVGYQGGKQYAFIKEYAMVKSINIQ